MHTLDYVGIGLSRQVRQDRYRSHVSALTFEVKVESQLASHKHWKQRETAKPTPEFKGMLNSTFKPQK